MLLLSRYTRSPYKPVHPWSLPSVCWIMEADLNGKQVDRQSSRCCRKRAREGSTSKLYFFVRVITQSLHMIKHSILLYSNQETHLLSYKEAHKSASALQCADCLVCYYSWVMHFRFWQNNWLKSNISHGLNPFSQLFSSLSIPTPVEVVGAAWLVRFAVGLGLYHSCVSLSLCVCMCAHLIVILLTQPCSIMFHLT